MPKPVLETGSGGITICEVDVQQGPDYGVIVSCAPTMRYVATYLISRILLNPAQATQSADDETVFSGISREIGRALRNMTKLRAKRAEKKPDGTIVPAVDEGRVLAEATGDVKTLIVEILSRLEPHKRDRRDVWHSGTDGMPPLEWQQQVFEQINNGRHPEFTLPARIQLVTPNTVLRASPLSVTIIDTQGIDDIAERADIEQHFDDLHTVVILCTRF